MSEMAFALKLLHRGLPTCIQQIKWKCPLQGKYGFVGAVPVALSVAKPSYSSPDNRISNHYDTEQEAIDALLSIGITRFQLSDCSWYKGK